MLKSFKIAWLLSVLILYSCLGSLFAKNIPHPADNKHKIIKKLQTVAPKVKANDINYNKLLGLYEIKDGAEVFYVTQDGKYLFVGNVLNLDNNHNLTEDLRKAARLAMMKAVPLTDMVIYKPKGKTKHIINIFTDVDCFYCRKLHQEISGYLSKGIEIRYLSFPRAGKGSDSYKKAQTIWCKHKMSERNKAMDQAKLTPDFKIAKELCKTQAVDKSIELVQNLNISGTPALLLEDGTLIPGFIPPEKIDLVFEKIDGQKQNDNNKKKT